MERDEDGDGDRDGDGVEMGMGMGLVNTGAAEVEAVGGCNPGGKAWY